MVPQGEPAVDVPHPHVAPRADNRPHVPARVIVVDDNADSADTLAMLVRVLGHEVRAIYDPTTVEAEVAAFHPSLVFLDVGMPQRSGYDVARSLRVQPGGRALRIVAVTGWGQPEDRGRTREAGFDEHLVKPPEPEAIRRICAATPSAAAAGAIPAGGRA